MKIISHRPRDDRYTLEGTFKDLRVADMLQINVEFKKNHFCVHGMSLFEYLRRFSGRHVHLLIHLIPHHGMPLRRFPSRETDNDQEFAYLASIIQAHPEYKYDICVSDPYRVEQLRRQFTKLDMRVRVGVMLSRYNLEQTLRAPKGVIQIVSMVDRRIMSIETINTLDEQTIVYCYVENDLKMYNTLKEHVHGIVYTPSN
jgi:hypothetical protein